MLVFDFSRRVRTVSLMLRGVRGTRCHSSFTLSCLIIYGEAHHHGLLGRNAVKEGGSALATRGTLGQRVIKGSSTWDYLETVDFYGPEDIEADVHRRSQLIRDLSTMDCFRATQMRSSTRDGNEQTA